MAIKVEVIEDLSTLYRRATRIIAEQLADGAKTFGLATGGTMLPLYENLRSSNCDFSQCTSFNLDEYVGLEKEHPESYLSFMNNRLFHAKPFKQSYLPDGEAEDVQAEAKRYEALLQKNTLDFQLLGVGENGHIGFNEPGTPFSSETHVVMLTESTRRANARFFNSIHEVPKLAITMGISTIMRAQCILLIAVGEKKRAALEALISGEISEQIPVTCLQKHPNVKVLTDIQLKGV
ncbi:glucosamine-6-phosphate deaminase [Lysinibacillus sp. 54212]|uniref:glucosamine-6-phosphate deaminase n=1 Tax=Lysinibacillus sp. 54212 TaxID=3119829 RepID=UPI002FC903F6